MVTWLIIIAIVILCFFVYFKYFKIPKLKNIVFIDGSLGTGKSALSVCLAIRIYKRNVKRWKIKRFVLHYLFNFGKFKGKWQTIERPLLYTNMLLRNVDFVLVTKDMLERKNQRFAYKSVLLLDEISLLADQMDYTDDEISERLSEFFKLFRHQTRGGFCVINSQSTSDLHYSLKYVLSDYFYIHSKTRFLGFSVLKVQECKFSADQSSIQVNTNDVEDNLKIMFMLNKYFKYYDTYQYSIFTDMLQVNDNVITLTKRDSLKNADILTFKKDYDDKYVLDMKNKNKRVRCSYIKENLKKGCVENAEKK